MANAKKIKANIKRVANMAQITIFLYMNDALTAPEFTVFISC